jgi:hypothetical protein
MCSQEVVIKNTSDFSVTLLYHPLALPPLHANKLQCFSMSINFIFKEQEIKD